MTVFTTAPSLNKLASVNVVIDEELVLDSIDQSLTKYKWHRRPWVFRRCSLCARKSADVPDGAGGVRVVVLGAKYTLKGNVSDAMAEQKISFPPWWRASGLPQRAGISRT